MPELPEVETVRRGIEPAMVGQAITSAQIRRPDLRWPFPVGMAERLTGAVVLRLRRRSKYILADLDTGETLLIHLGMSGRMTVTAPTGNAQPGVFYDSHKPVEKHDHVILDMANGMRITFNDPRRFGAMDLLETAGAETHKLLANIGPEPLGNQFDGTYLYTALKPKKSPIKSALLDQRLIAGLGNIYVCEVLWRTGIAPTRIAGSLSKNRIVSLVPAIRDVLSEAIEAGGSSLKDHRQASGELGYFQHRFAVYDRAGLACSKPDCGGAIERIVQSGRSSFYCNNCQS